MGRQIDYDAAGQLLAETFAEAEADFIAGRPVPVPPEMADATDRLFASSVQALREALLGCALARALDPEIDIRLPYMSQGENAFNGRTLDERVVNPFLHDRAIPSSKGPYLSAFRRTVRFEPETAKGLRDKKAYAAMLAFIDGLQMADRTTARRYLRHLLHAFVRLRDAANVTLSRIHRLSVEQYEEVIGALLQVRSGGLMPVLLAVAAFQTIKDCFNLDWEIEWQGINVADRASGVGGDITVRRAGAIVLAVEITERPIDRARVVSTFNTKIAPHGIDDYLFMFAAHPPTEDARAAARRYFAQGHEVNFTPIRDWIVAMLTTVGPKCRALFTEKLLALLAGRDIPAALKVAWNDRIKELGGR